MSVAAPAPGTEPRWPASPALPDDGPRLLLAPSPAEPPDDGVADPSQELLQLADAAESLLGDPRLDALADLLRDAAAAVAAADAHVAAARSEAARIAARGEEEVARLWRTVSADVAERRSATDAFVARAREKAERAAESLLADASARADLLLARADDLVAAWLDEANAEVARILEGAPPPPAALAPVADGASKPRGLRRLFRRTRRR